MDDILALMIDWPAWAVYAVVGAILGAASGLVGWALEKGGLKFGKYAVIAGLAATPLVSREMILPAIINAYSNKSLPIQIDDVTTLVKIEYAAKKYIYHYKLADEVADDVDIDVVKQAGLTDMCNYWRSAFAANEVDSAEYRYNLHGRPVSFFVKPIDCGT